MAASWKKLYVFVSSTFEDMHAERDYLVKRVFPELREWCELRRLQLIDVDLRWGVTAQDAEHSRNVVKICLEHIDRCRPFFLCFLGQRRGWVPTLSDVSEETLASLPGLADHLGKVSVTELEILHSVLGPFGMEPGHPCLHAFFYLRDPSYLDQLPGPIRPLYTNEAVEDPVLRERDLRALSKWREEVIPNSGRLVRHYAAKFDGRASTPELQLPLHPNSLTQAGVARWLASWRRAGLDLEPGTAEIEENSPSGKAALEINRQRIQGRLGDFTCEDGATLGHAVLESLKRAIEEEYPDHANPEIGSPLRQELEQQERFLLNYTEGFIDRPDQFNALDVYARGEAQRVLELRGPAGIGKTALLANWVDRFRRQNQESGDYAIYFRFIGASDRSTDAGSLLESLLQEWKQDGKLDQCPVERSEIYRALGHYLEMVAAKHRVVLVLDGLNQLDMGLTDLSWIPQQLPKNVRIIVSVREDRDSRRDTKIKDALKAHQPILARVSPLDREEDQRRLIHSFTSQYLKQLDDHDVQALISSVGASNPLYLKAVLSELRVFGSFSGLRQKIREDFGDTPKSAFEAILRRVEADAATGEVESGQVVPLIFGFLSHARQGLTVAELVDLLEAEYPFASSEAGPEQRGIRRLSLQDAVNGCIRQLRSFLESRAQRIDFFYEALRLASSSRYTQQGSCPKARSPEQWHGVLADYFYRQVTSGGAPGSSVKVWKGQLPRAYQEFLFHAIRGRQWLHLVEAFCDREFHRQCIGVTGHLPYLLRFKELVFALSNDPDGMLWLRRLCDEIPIIPTTRPLLEDLAVGAGQDLVHACALLKSALEPGKDPERAEIPFEALLKLTENEDRRLNLAEAESIRELLPSLLQSANNRIAWRTCESYWQILPTADAAPLLKTAVDEKRSPLVRAEAARRLGECDDLSLVAPLGHLATANVFPLSEMARRSAARILASHGRLSPDLIDDWSQPAEMPASLKSLFGEIEQLGVTVDTRGLKEGKPLIISLNEPSNDSFELKWMTIRVILLILRQLPCTIICPEGADREVTLTPVKDSSSPEFMRRAATRFFWDGVIAPEEYLNLATDYPIRLLGVEYRDLYDQASAEKFRGGPATAAVASVERCSGMLDNCFRWVDRYQCPVVILLSKVLPGFMMSRLMGLPASDGDRMLESILPSKVTSTHPRADHYSFARINLTQLEDTLNEEFSSDPHVQHLLLNQYSAQQLSAIRGVTRVDDVDTAESAARELNEEDLASLRSRNLRGQVLVRADLREWDLSAANGWHSNLSGSDLSAVSLRGARLQGAKLSEARLPGADLEAVNLFDARLNNADLSGANLSRANLVGVDLNSAKLRGANLAGACLHGANLRGADLTGSQLHQADLRSTFLGGAILREANLNGATMAGARYNPETVWPGLVPEDENLILVDPPISESLARSLATQPGLHLANLAIINLRHGHESGHAQLATVISQWEEVWGVDTPAIASSMNVLVRGLQIVGLHEVALPLARRAVQIWRHSQTHLDVGLNNLGLSLFELGNLTAAETVLLEAVSVKPSNAHPYYWLAKVYRGMKEESREAAMWKTYLDIGPSTTERRDEAVSRLDRLRDETTQAEESD